MPTCQVRHAKSIIAAGLGQDYRHLLAGWESLEPAQGGGAAPRLGAKAPYIGRVQSMHVTRHWRSQLVFCNDAAAVRTLMNLVTVAPMTVLQRLQGNHMIKQLEQLV